MALPAALGLAALWLGAESVRPDPRSEDGAIGLGLLIASPIAFWAYPILFRPSDDGLLRRLSDAGVTLPGTPENGWDVMEPLFQANRPQPAVR